MSDLNTFSLSGHLGDAPELKKTQSGVSMARFSIATESYSKENGSETMWLDLVAWRHNADFISKYAKKGDFVAVTGRIQIATYQDQASGHNRKVTNLIADTIALSKNKKKQTDDNPNVDAGQNTFVDLPETDIVIDPEDVPF